MFTVFKTNWTKITLQHPRFELKTSKTPNFCLVKVQQMCTTVYTKSLQKKHFFIFKFVAA